MWVDNVQEVKVSNTETQMLPKCDLCSWKLFGHTVFLLAYIISVNVFSSIFQRLSKHLRGLIEVYLTNIPKHKP